MVLDQTGDQNGQELHRLQKLYTFPSFVLSELAGDRQKSASDGPFAYPVRNQFPCHTPGSTWISTLFFLEKRSEINCKEAGWISGRLDKYASHFGIRTAVENLKQRHAELRKDSTDELPDSYFVYVWTDDDTGNKTRKLPMRNEHEIKAAADWLDQYRDDFCFADRKTMATKVLKRANELSADVGEHQQMLEKQSGNGLGDPKKIASALRNRSRLVKSAELKSKLTALADVTERLPEFILTHDSLVKTAEILDGVDRDLHLVGKYTDIIARPEDVLFGITFTKAADWRNDHCSTLTGAVYNRNDFSKLALSDVQALFGDELVEAVKSGFRVDPEKMAEVSATLPRPDAELLDQLMLDSGVSPVMKQASARNVGFSVSQLQALAKAL